MATKSDTTIVPRNNTDAEFRAWAQFIHDVFNLTSCWVNTSDTGQINLSTVTKPTLTHESRGYEIWRMNDTLQSTYPVYLKIEYGSGAAALTPAVWITIGKGSDGSGNITTIRFARTQFTSGTNNSATHDYFGSASTNRIGVCCGTGITNRATQFYIERSKDSSGNDTNDGLIVIGTEGSAYINRVYYVKMNQVGQPSYEFPLYIRSTNGAFDSNVAMGVIMPLAGIPQQPGTNLFVARNGDFSNTGAPTINIYGSTITLQGLNNAYTWHVAGGTDASARTFMRFE